jgi:hypothetical protein
MELPDRSAISGVVALISLEMASRGTVTAPSIFHL